MLPALVSTIEKVVKRRQILHADGALAQFKCKTHAPVTHLGVKSSPVIKHDGGMSEHRGNAELLTHLPERYGDSLRYLIDGIDATPDICMGEETEQ